MAEHEKLHPLRPILKNWIWEHGRVGTRFLDMADGEIKFDEGKKSKFAAEEYVYVPLDKVLSAETHKLAPAIQEAGLARFLRAAQMGKPAEAGSAAEIQRAVHDCVELGLFSAYQQAAKAAYARYAEEPLFEEEICAEVEKEIRQVYVEMREQLALFDYTVLYGFPTPLLVGDTPFIDWRIKTNGTLPFVSLPLGPFALLVGAQSGRTSKSAPLVWKSVASLGPLKEHNRIMAEHARMWLVATTDDQLAAAKSRFVGSSAK